MAERQCSGSPTFNLAVSENAYSEWPEYISGFICKTPPVGLYSAANFAKCCSGKVYNITTPTTPDDPAYPMSCALFCQVDPAFNALNDKNPYHFSDYFLCLNDGVDGDGGETVCATNSVDGKVTMPSFTSTPTGAWETMSVSSSSQSLSYAESAALSSSTVSPSTSSTSATEISSTTGEDSTTGPITTTTSPISSATEMPATTTTTTGSASQSLGVKAVTRVLGLLLVLSALGV